VLFIMKMFEDEG